MIAGPHPLALAPEDLALLRRVTGTSPTFAARVFAKIDAAGDCWQWTAALNKGYGVIGRGGRKAGNMEAHRAVWGLLVGQIGAGLELDHLCRNRACCNPDHLEPVTAEENKRRGYSAAVLYGKRDTCAFGHPLDGRTGGRGGREVHRYCKTCARLRMTPEKLPREPVTHCKRSHEFTPENTYVNCRGNRECKRCKANRQRAARAASKLKGKGAALWTLTSRQLRLRCSSSPPQK